MDQNKALISQSLKKIPDGNFDIHQHNSPDEYDTLCIKHLVRSSEGKGKIDVFKVFPGIELSFHQYLAKQIVFHSKSPDYILALNYCQNGQICWKMRDKSYVYLGPGNLCLHSLQNYAGSKIVFPLGYYEGIGVALDLLELKKTCPNVLQEAGFDAEKIYEKFCLDKKPLRLPPGQNINMVFSLLNELSENLRIPYYKLKVQEALLHLQQVEADVNQDIKQYSTQQIELIQKIHDFLIQNLDNRYTIEELSKRYLLNTSLLKSAFKAVYGMPIGTYMKEYRMQQAMRLLRETDNSIAFIAEQVGYATPGKFTTSFKKFAHILPTEYRRIYKR